MAFMKRLQLLQTLEQMVRTERSQTTRCENCDQLPLPSNPFLADGDSSMDFK
jgi:hypothetical protein